MESLTSTFTIATAPPSSLSIFTPRSRDFSSRRLLRYSTSPKNNGSESELRSDSNNESTDLVPIFGRQTLSKDAAMGLVLSSVNIRGWTTGSGMEGPSAPVNSESGSQVSTFPWSLFTKSPRRRMRVAFTCNICGQRTTRAINPHAYTDGTVFVQCCGCNAYHKLVDNLNLFDEMKCYVNSSFNPDANANLGLKYFDMDGDDSSDRFPLS